MRFFLKYITYLLFAVFSLEAVSQNNSYFDSLTSVLLTLSQEEKINTTLAIPFDKMNSNAVAAIKFYQQALKYQSSDDLKGRLNEKLALASYYKGDYDLSVKYSLTAITFYERTNNKQKTGNVYASLGYQMKRRNLPKAFEYMQKGVQILQQVKDKEALSGAYNNYGVLFEMDNKIDSALFYYQKGLLIINSIGDSIGIPYSLNNIAGAYVIIGEYQLAKKYYDKAFNIREKRHDINGLAENYAFYGDLCFKQGQFKGAVPNYRKARELSIDINYTYLQKVNCEQLSICYEKLGKFDKALKYQRETTLLKDSLLNESTNNVIAKLETRFQTAEKEKEIAEQRVEISAQQLKAEQRNYLLLGLLLIVAFIIIISRSIYKQQKFKQQKLIEENQLKDQIAQVKIQNKLHEERLRISRDLHDNIGSQLTFIISSVDNMKHLFRSEDEKLNNKLTDVSSFTRTTITQLRDTIWALNKDEINFDDLKSRLFNYIENAQLAQEQTEFIFKDELTSEFLLNSIQGVNIYRIVQEAINNAMKYAAATHVSLIISEKNENIFLSIKDDGVGFNMPEIQLGNGLENMKNRANEISAEFAIVSESKKGTEIKLSLNKIKLTQV